LLTPSTLNYKRAELHVYDLPGSVDAHVAIIDPTAPLRWVGQAPSCGRSVRLLRMRFTLLNCVAMEPSPMTHSDQLGSAADGCLQCLATMAWCTGVGDRRLWPHAFLFN
jgi:hypothetical protein